MTISQFFSLRGVRAFSILLLCNMVWMCAEAEEYTEGPDEYGFNWYQFDESLADFPNERITIIMASPDVVLSQWLMRGNRRPPAGKALGGFAMPGHERCYIYLSVPNPTTIPTIEMIEHEVRHCRGWAHKPVTQ